MLGQRIWLTMILLSLTSTVLKGQGRELTGSSNVESGWANELESQDEEIHEKRVRRLKAGLVVSAMACGISGKAFTMTAPAWATGLVVGAAVASTAIGAGIIGAVGVGVLAKNTRNRAAQVDAVSDAGVEEILGIAGVRTIKVTSRLKRVTGVFTQTAGSTTTRKGMTPEKHAQEFVKKWAYKGGSKRATSFGQLINDRNMADLPTGNLENAIHDQLCKAKSSNGSSSVADDYEAKVYRVYKADGIGLFVADEDVDPSQFPQITSTSYRYYEIKPKDLAEY